ncbi:MAG: hypothetical protein ACK53Y_17960, partial [bacterium]
LTLVSQQALLNQHFSLRHRRRKKMHKDGVPKAKSTIHARIKTKKNNREERDRRTYVMSPIKGANTMSKQWSRYEGWTP